MMFRTPTDDPTSNLIFYENEYTQRFAITPSADELAKMKKSNFSAIEKDYSYYIKVLTRLGLKPGDRLFDYGCSWGYGSYQLAQAGFEVTSFEVAPSRRRYAQEKLGVSTVESMDSVASELSSHFDCFFSAHVLEHVPSPAVSFNYAIRLLKQDALFVAFTPNGSRGSMAASRDWSKIWGEVHPNFIDDIFLDSSFKLSPRAIGSSPLCNATLPLEVELKRLNEVDGKELFFAARKIGDSWC